MSGAIVMKEFNIYNRWGQQVFSDGTNTEGWNGNYKNDTAPSGVYAYYMLFDIKGCPTVNKQGNVTLIR